MTSSARQRIVLLMALIMVMLVGRCDAEHHHTVRDVGRGATIGNTAALRSRLTAAQDKIKSIMREYAKGNGMSHYLPSLNSTVGTSCHDDLETFHSSEDLWTVQMFDSWGKFPDGFVIRIPTVLGMYDECLKAKNDTLNISGRYCLISIWKPLDDIYNTSMKRTIHNAIPRIGVFEILPPPLYYIQYGTCMPDACTEQQLKSSLEDIHAEEEDKHVSVHCSKDNIILDGVDISFIVFCSVFLVLMLSGAALDYYMEITQNHQLGKGPLRFLLPFSVTTNLKKVFHINTNTNPNTISCLHGMRVMSMCWVVFGHQYSMLFDMKLYNLVLVAEKVDNLLFQIIANADVSVDSFFFLSGLLVAYGVLREIKKTGKINIIMFYVHRILRLTPPIAMVVWFYASVNRHLVSGPQAYFEYDADHLASTCRKYGWRDILYLTNVQWDNYEPDDVCLLQCWYTAIDTQLYLIAPLLILPLYYFKDMGRAWLYTITIISVIVPGAMLQRYINTHENTYVNMIYTTPWCRAGPWIVGIWTGYIIFKTGNKLQLKKWQVVAGWTAAFVTAWMILLGKYRVNMNESVTTYIIYEAFHRGVWGACLAWVAIACHNGYGGIVNNFLSHPVWQPVSRLTYGLYLIALELQNDLTKYNRKNLFYFTELNMIIDASGSLFLSGIGAVLITLVAEAPVLGLEKLIFDRPGHGPDKPEVKKPQEPAVGNDNGAFLTEENELKQLSGENENAKIEGNEIPYTQTDIKE